MAYLMLNAGAIFQDGMVYDGRQNLSKADLHDLLSLKFIIGEGPFALSAVDKQIGIADDDV